MSTAATPVSAMPADASPRAAVSATMAAPLTQLDNNFPATTLTLADGAQLVVRRCGPPDGGRDEEHKPGPQPDTFVLLHGISSGAASWLRCALALGARGGTVFAWDAPGYGASTPLPMAAPQAADYAARLRLMLQALQIGTCVLVGHSLGALMAAACARAAPAGLVRRLVLISPAAGYGGADRSDARERMRRQRLDDLAALGIDGLAQRAPERLLSAQADAEARAWVRWNAERLTAAGYRQAVALLCDGDLRHDAGFALPVHVLCGDADVVTPPAACRQLAEQLRAPFTLIAGAGHASPIEQPDAVAAAIAA